MRWYRKTAVYMTSRVVTQEMLDAHNRYMSEFAMKCELALKMDMDTFTRKFAVQTFYEDWEYYCNRTHQECMKVRYDAEIPSQVIRQINKEVYEAEYLQAFNETCDKYHIDLDLKTFRHQLETMHMNDFPF